MSFTTPLLLLVLLPAALVIALLGWPRARFRRLRDAASLLVRLVIATLLVLALAGAQTDTATDRLAVAFLVDQSDSISAAERAAQLRFIRDALAGMASDDQAAVIAFGGNAVIERPLSSSRELGAFRSTPLAGNTDLEEAINLALALLPDDLARRIVVLSDGEQTVGSAEAAARRAAALGVTIDIVPFARADAPDVRVVDVHAPNIVTAGQRFDIRIEVEADEATEATLTVLAGGAVVYREAVALEAGSNAYALALQAGETGFRDFRVQVEPLAGDAFFQNNALAAFTRVTGAPRVLLIAPEGASDDDAINLQNALTALGYTVDVRTPDALPLSATALVSYDSVLLANVPASALAAARMRALQTYVRDLGGGMVMIGGENSYAPGGYFDTPIAEMLPVELRLDDQQRVPQLTITYVIDRSGSMSVIGPSGVENLELAKEAIIRSIEFLQPTDRAGVISFDTEGVVIAEVQPVLDRLTLQTQVASMRAGGGTDILAGYQLAGQALQTDESPRRHIILLTDGGADPRGLVEYADAIYNADDITTSVIAIGDGAPPFLADLAAAGGGNFHLATDVASIPNIFTQEAVLATRSYFIEETFTPAQSADSPIMSGLNALPPLLGYVATSPRPTAQTVLVGPEPYRDPLLAQWQYGLGRVIAFTSDASARWSANWIGWSEFARFWSQAVQWTVTETASTTETQITMQGEQAVITVDARDTAGDFYNGLALTARVVGPDGSAQDVPVRQVAPGQYQADFTPSGDGAYLVRLVGGDAETVVNETVGWVMSYSAEYLPQATDGAAVLAVLRETTGGRDLAAGGEPTPAEAFARTLRARAAVQSIAPALLLVAALLLPLDIAIRRLLVTQSDLARARGALLARRAVPDTSAHLSDLKQAKARAQTQASAAANAVSPVMPPAPAETAAALRARRQQAAPSPVAATPTPDVTERRTAMPAAAAPAREVAEGQVARREEPRREEPRREEPRREEPRREEPRREEPRREEPRRDPEAPGTLAGELLKRRKRD